MSKAAVAIDITANDKTRKGILSAERGLAKLPKAANDAGKAVDRTNAAARRFSAGGLSSMARTFGAVEKASARAFGGSSVISQAAGRLGVLGEVGSAVGTGLGEASAGAGVLGAALGAVGVVAAASVAVLAGVAVGAYKLADGWASNVAGLGRLSATLGIATKDLQEFQQAGERAGLDKAATTGAVSGIARSMYDAVNGRNVDAAAAMAHYGISLKKKADGSYDYTQATLDLADVVKRQPNGQAQEKVAEFFGAQSALPLLRQGSGAIRRDMADIDRHGVVNSDADVAKASRFVRDKATLDQRAARGMNAAGGAAAGLGVTAMDGVIAAAQDPGGTIASFKSSVVDTFKPAVEAFGRTIDRLAGVIGGQTWSNTRVASMAKGGAHFRDRLMAMGIPAPAAAGLAASIMGESGGQAHRAEVGGGPGYGLAQWGKHRQADFRAWAGKDIRQATEDEQLAFLKHELFDADGKERAAGAKLLGATGAADAGDAATRYYERPLMVGKDAANRAALAEQIDRQPVKVQLTHRFEGLPAGAKVTTTQSGSSSVAIGHAQFGDNF